MGCQEIRNKHKEVACEEKGLLKLTSRDAVRLRVSNAHLPHVAEAVGPKVPLSYHVTLLLRLS